MNISQENNENAKLGLFPGKFDPFTEANVEIVDQALLVFDQILILVCDKEEEAAKQRATIIAQYYEEASNVGVGYWSGLLVNFISGTRVSAIIRTLKNSTILQKEKDLYYSHQDLGVKLPFVYFMTSRENSHVSSEIHKDVVAYLN